MLADKLASMRATFAALANAESSTPRLLAQARGKAAHYGCAVQHLACICPALTQAIHQAETVYCLPAPGLTEEASDSKFDWDQPLIISQRTRAALALLIRTTDQLGSAGQPMWPTSPIVAFEDFARGADADPTAPTIVALFQSTPAGWGWALRTRADAVPSFIHGSWESAPALLGADWMAQPLFEDSGAPRDATQRHALAVLFGFHAASRLSDLPAASLIIRTSSQPSIIALQHGSTADPALQDIAMLFQAACLQLVSFTAVGCVSFTAVRHTYRISPTRPPVISSPSSPSTSGQGHCQGQPHACTCTSPDLRTPIGCSRTPQIWQPSTPS